VPESEIVETLLIEARRIAAESGGDTPSGTPQVITV
jgi:hypothetical protein